MSSRPQPSTDPITRLRGGQLWQFADRAQCMGCGGFTQRQPGRVLYTRDGLYYRAIEPCKHCGKWHVRLRVLDVADEDPPEDEIPIHEEPEHA